MKNIDIIISQIKSAVSDIDFNPKQIKRILTVLSSECGKRERKFEDDLQRDIDKIYNNLPSGCDIKDQWEADNKVEKLEEIKNPWAGIAEIIRNARGEIDV